MPNNKHHIDISQPITIAGFTLKNRIVKAAMSENLAANNGNVTKAYFSLYETWAKGGVGAVITGNVMVDRRAKNEPNVVVVEDESDMPALTAWAQIGKQYNMLQIVQLSHPGKQAPKGLNALTVAPSAIGFSGTLASFFAIPQALSEAEILDLIDRFAKSAAICKAAGFAGVQLHGAHGYLISQFLSPQHNQRTDQWGGSLVNRMRFALEIYQAVRAATGPDFIVGIKLNSADFQKGGMSETEALSVFKALDAVGIDFIEISGGTYEAPAMTGIGVQKESTQRREAYFLQFAELARSQVKTVLMVTGGFRSRDAMDNALASGACDLVGIARPFAVEPDAANSLLLGKNVKYAVQPIKTGISLFDKTGMMEVVWYAQQFKAIANGKPPNPQLSPLKVAAKYVLGNLSAALRGKRVRA